MKKHEGSYQYAICATWFGRIKQLIKYCSVPERLIEQLWAPATTRAGVLGRLFSLAARRTCGSCWVPNETVLLCVGNDGGVDWGYRVWAPRGEWGGGRKWGAGRLRFSDQWGSPIAKVQAGELAGKFTFNVLGKHFHSEIDQPRKTKKRNTNENKKRENKTSDDGSVVGSCSLSSARVTSLRC